MPAPIPFFSDCALSTRLEAAEAAMLTALVRTLSSARPERHPAVLPIAGGCAAFLGADVSPSRAVGLGMSGPVASSDVDALEDFYRSRGMAVRILVSPFADPSLFEQLGAHGFRVLELDSMLVRRIEPGEVFPAPAGDAVVRGARPDEAAAWVRTSLEAMLESSEPPRAEVVEIFSASFHTSSSRYFFASIGDAVAGTGALDIHEGAAYFFATGTLPVSRRRGVQGALIAARLAAAQAAGCDVCFSRTAAGSSSQRNLERQGFRSIYSRASMIKRFD
jgi:GNAT superfamily N-acetyltransferase